MKKALKNAEIIGILSKIRKSAEVDESNPERAARIPFDIQWKKRLNQKELEKVRETIAEAEREIDKIYTDDEHSYAVKNENGSEIRRVKNAYLAEFSAKKAALYSAETDVEICTVSSSELEEISLTDLQMDSLFFMIQEESTHGKRN